MVSQKALRRILDSVAALGGEAIISAQVAEATFGTVMTTVAGLFADISVAGSAGIAPADIGKRGILAELRCDAPVADAILHIEDGIIRYLEIWFYDTVDFDCIEHATVH